MSCYRTCPHCGAHITPESADRAGPPSFFWNNVPRETGVRSTIFLSAGVYPPTSASSLRRAADTTRPPPHTHIPLNGFYPPFSKKRSIGKSSPLRSLSPIAPARRVGGGTKEDPAALSRRAPLGAPSL